jgi:hypothetical protein
MAMAKKVFEVMLLEERSCLGSSFTSMVGLDPQDQEKAVEKLTANFRTVVKLFIAQLAKQDIAEKVKGQSA